MPPKASVWHSGSGSQPGAIFGLTVFVLLLFPAAPPPPQEASTLIAKRAAATKMRGRPCLTSEFRACEFLACEFRVVRRFLIPLPVFANRDANTLITE